MLYARLGQFVFAKGLFTATSDWILMLLGSTLRHLLPTHILLHAQEDAGTVMNLGLIFLLFFLLFLLFIIGSQTL